MDNQQVKENSWMANGQLDEETRKSEFVQDLFETFFEERTEHHFNESRLYWLYHWIGNTDVIEKIQFLILIWKMEYFHPFATPDNTGDMISSQVSKGNRNLYTVSLSSTVAGLIRVTFCSALMDGIVHRRINIDHHISESNGYKFSCPIQYNLFVLIEEVEKLLLHHNPDNNTKYHAVKYVSTFDDESQKESPMPYRVD